MRILFIASGFNSLSQRLFVELTQLGHEISVELDIDDATSEQAVDLFAPDLILAPFLKRAIPESIFSKHLCLIVHPGIPGDRGPSALDWAILNQEPSWGVTVLQAEAKMDAGPIWAAAGFPMRKASKSSLYRNEVTDAAVKAVLQALKRVKKGEGPPAPEKVWTEARGIERPPCKQVDREINWRQDDSETVLRKMLSADGAPGIKNTLRNRTVFLHDPRPATGLTGEPGSIVAKSGPAICRATTDGAVWIGYLRDKAHSDSFKLPATDLLADNLDGVLDIPVDSECGYHEITYEEKDGVGYLGFDFYNGAMSTAQCERLLAAYHEACKRDTKVIVLTGGYEYWSNGIHLNLIEAADSAADESWRNINAIDDLAEAIIRTESHITVAALQGNAGAGGVFLARAADQVWLRSGVILSPHYKDMGNLHGSEFWTYHLPRCAGEKNAQRIIDARLPMGADEAIELGLGEAKLAEGREAFLAEMQERAETLATEPSLDAMLKAKSKRRTSDELEKPLAQYREEELEEMRTNFYGANPSYHIARYNFVHKVGKSRTAITIARHRDRGRRKEKKAS